MIRCERKRAARAVRRKSGQRIGRRSGAFKTTLLYRGSVFRDMQNYISLRAAKKHVQGRCCNQSRGMIVILRNDFGEKESTINGEFS